jgi:hypothetical protein
MADAATIPLSPAHAPKAASVEAFKSAWHEIKNEFHKCRQRWDEHEPEMFSRVAGHTDHELLEDVDLEKALVQVRTGESAYLPCPKDPPCFCMEADLKVRATFIWKGED